MLLVGLMLICIFAVSSSSFQPASPLLHLTRSASSSALAYAGTSSSAAGPMSQVDPNARSGGCPFLVKSHDAQVTYAVPALFNNNNSNNNQQRPIVLFDGSCTLCNNFVQFLLKYDVYGNLRFAALQSKVGELLLRRMSQEVRDEVLHQTTTAAEGEGEGSNEGKEGGGGEKYKSIVLCTPDETYIQSSAVLKILAALSSSTSTSSTTTSSSSSNIKPSKRIKLLQYLGLIGYIIPTKLRDSMYKYISKRRKSWFGSADECMLYDERFDNRFVDDGVLTGVYRDPFANPNAPPPPPSKEEEKETVTNLFESDNPPKRGDTVQIIWPSNTNLDPSITYDDEFPNGLCLIGGRGTISTIDLPMRIVLRVERKSLGLDENDGMGEETMIAWVKPSEVALV